MKRPFEGVRILDFTQVSAGPLASYQLALLGAEVIKVERPGGEDMRGRQAEGSTSPGWIAINAGKKNIAMDLKHPEAVNVVKRLVAECDVVMENFRAGVMDRLGIGYDALKAVNPRLIYCCVSGFGREGPLSDDPAYDGKIQALSGIMSVTGHETTGPVRAGFAVCDATAGMTAAFAVSSALFQRTHTGEGQLVDVAMYDSALTMQAPAVGSYTMTGKVPGQSGNRAISGLPTADLFPVKGGHLLLAANNEKQFVALMHAIDRADVLEDRRFADWPARIENEPALNEIIYAAFAAADADSWEARLREHDVPCAQIQNIGEAVTHEQLAARNYMQTVDTHEGPVTLGTTGFQLAEGGAALTAGFAHVGEHTEAVLTAAGFTISEVSALKDSGAVSGA